MNKIQQFKEAALKYFRDGEWNDTDPEMVALHKASTWDAIRDAIWNIALYIGDRKGYGDEGTASLYEGFIVSIEVECKINFCEDVPDDAA